MKSAMDGVRSIDSLAEYRKFLTHCPLFRLAVEDIARFFELGSRDPVIYCLLTFQISLRYFLSKLICGKEAKKNAT